MSDTTSHDRVWELMEVERPINKEALEKHFVHHLQYSVGKHRFNTQNQDIYKALSLTIRDLMVDRLNETQHNYRIKNPKRIYYLSLEFLIGRTLTNALINLGVDKLVEEMLTGMGYDLNEITECEADAGLGNGGLGRLAACFMDSMATLNLPGYGYGIRYDYGIFNQHIENGAQIEKPDHWLSDGSPWGLVRADTYYQVHFYGHVGHKVDPTGKVIQQWIPVETVLAVPHDYPVPGYNTTTVNNLRLWSSRSSEEFNLDYFNHGDYGKAVEDKQKTENISKVLYPNDVTEQGKLLRLKQQYFMVSASLQDIINRYKRANTNYNKFADEVAIQLNDTHPSIAIPELMRILIDIEKMDWDEAWSITTKVFSYTNHTVLPEALETWNVSLIEYLLPRHIQIIYEINFRFLEEAKVSGTMTDEELSQMSIVQEGGDKKLRMANLAVIGSHKVNGVAALHSELLKTIVFPAFYKYTPEKFTNKTNGITQRRFLLKANPSLSKLIYSKIGDKFISNLSALKEIEGYLGDKEFCENWRLIKKENKEKLAKVILSETGIVVDTDSLFDVQVKRFHEYKRQLLNILHVIGLYVQIHRDPNFEVLPRTFIFGGKAAPGYYMAKLIIRLINAVASKINSDPLVRDRIKVVFLPNYRVSQAEIIFPASDLSEQISTAGTEASGTGNMKFALNGALTIGTLDGANIEIMEEVGEENIYIFGLKANEVFELKHKGYDPKEYLDKNSILQNIFTLIKENFFIPDASDLFKPIYDSLTTTDTYMLLADYQSYADCQKIVSKDYKNTDSWTKKSILNVARMGKFSSDRTIMEYANEIWKVKQMEVKPPKTTFKIVNDRF
ncbi:MAG: glycogen/starch/alpha-glucan phosphorylase [Leptospiraceae bacterium]|nr:glycogen/starch/alpha-glucan phosphorylase [Leptospiraceae bacterium]MCP5497827.1 glycogen/starch/alpha-glucan phosphorylase [Leptospiraceae bacterium]